MDSLLKTIFKDTFLKKFVCELWDIIKTPQGIRSVVVSPDRKSVFLGALDGDCAEVNIRTRKKINTFTDQVKFCLVTPDNQFLYTVLNEG